MKMQRAAVVGAGAMGSGIAQVLSQSGMEVILKDVNAEFVDKGLANIRRMYDSRVKREALTQTQADSFFSSVTGATSYDGFENVDIVIEAALEQIEVKLGVFKELDKVCRPQTVLATNTSALSITEIASHNAHPERVIGMHFFNPAQAMKLVEVIPGLQTSRQIVDDVLQLCKDLHKVPVKIEECPGFLVNRLLFPYMNEALYALQEGIADPLEIDKALVEFGMPMGPLALFDMTGLDVCSHVNEFLYKEYGPRFEPAKILKLLVEHKHLGQKSGAGFYLHSAVKEEVRQVNPNLAKLLQSIGDSKANAAKNKEFNPYRVILPMLNEAIYAIQEHVVEAADIDVAMKWGCGMNNGLLAIAQTQGLDWCLNQLEGYQKLLGERFRPAWLLRKLVRGQVHDFVVNRNTPAAVR